MGRKSKVATRVAKYRASLNDDKRNIVKSKNVKYVQIKRSQMSKEEKEFMKSQDKILKGKAKAKMTEDDRDIMNRKIKENMIKYRAEMSETKKQEENCKAKERMSKLYSEMSPELKREKIDRMREYQNKRLSEETHDEKITRLQKLRNYYLSRKLYKPEDFLKERYDFTYEPCFFCRRMLFTKQIDIISSDKIIVPLPHDIQEMLEEKMIVCHRCSNALCKRGKIPSQVFWNSLDPGKIPPELKVLSDVEVRMVSRLIPYMKIVRLSGTFGQWSIKGQAVLFAQDVTEVKSEIIDILPRKMNQIELVVVVESRQNVEYQRSFEVSPIRLKNALVWLINNNQLYKDLPPIDVDNLEINYEEIVVVQPRRNDDDDGGIENIDEWRQIKPNEYVLSCKRHQLLSCFGEFAGKQSFSMGIAALVKHYFKSINFWDQTDLDVILDNGQRLHEESVEEFIQTSTFEKMNGLRSEVIIDFSNIKRSFELYDNEIEIAFNNKEYNLINIKTEFLYYFETRSFGLISTGEEYFPIFKDDDEFFLFDPRPRGKNGFSTKLNNKGEYNGSAIAYRCKNIDNYIKKLKMHLGCKTGIFTLSEVIISLKNDAFEKIVSTFGDQTPILHTNPILKENNHEDDENNGIEVDDIEPQDKNHDFIFYASKCQSDPNYKSEYRGKQCTAMSVAAAIKCTMGNPSSWNQETLDDILDTGNYLYGQSYLRLKMNHSGNSRFDMPCYLCATEITPRAVVFKKNFKINVEFVTAGLINDIEAHLKKFFQAKNYQGIFTCQEKSYTIMHDQGCYWLFDSHNCCGNYDKAALYETNFNGLNRLLKSRISNDHLNNQNLSDFDNQLKNTFNIYSVKTFEMKEFNDDFSQKNKIDDDNLEEYQSEIDVNSAKHKISQLERSRSELKKPKTEVNADENICSLLSRSLSFKDNDENVSETVQDDRIKFDKFNNMTLYASFCQSNNLKYRVDFRGIQCTAMSTAAAIYNCIFDCPSQWKTKIMNEILDNGNFLYGISYENQKIIQPENPYFSKPCYLSADEIIQGNITLFNRKINLEIQYFGTNRINDIRESLRKFFSSYNQGIFTCQSKSYAIMTYNGSYWLFDSHDCDNTGTAAVYESSFEGFMKLIKSRISMDNIHNKTLNIQHDSINQFEVSSVHANIVETTESYTPVKDNDISQKLFNPSAIKKIMFEDNNTPKKSKQHEESKCDSDCESEFDNKTPIDIDYYERFLMTPTPKKNDESIELEKEFNARNALLNLEEEFNKVKDSYPALNLSDFNAELQNISSYDCPHDPICHNCTKDALYMQSLSFLQNIQDIDENMLMFSCISAILNTCVDSTTGWTENRLESVLSEAQYLTRKKFTKNSGATIFNTKFEIDIEGFSVRQLDNITEKIQMLFHFFDYGLLQIASETYAIMNINDAFCLFEPSYYCEDDDEYFCNIFVTYNFEVFIQKIISRAQEYNIDLNDQENYTIKAVQILSINDEEVIQKDLPFYDQVITTSIGYTYKFSSQMACTCIMSAVCNMEKPILSWIKSTLDSVRDFGMDLWCKIGEICMNSEEIWKQYLALIPKILETERNIKLKMSSPEQYMNLTSRDCEEVFSDFLIANKLTILRISSDVSIDNYYFVAYNNGIYSLLNPYESTFANAVVRSSITNTYDVSKIFETIMCSLDDKILENSPRFSLWDVKISKIDDRPSKKNNTNDFICPEYIMRPTDYDVPRPDKHFKIVNNESTDKTMESENIPILNLNRKTEPPVNELHETRHEELCFPVLFPLGKNGVNETRAHKMSELQYFQSRIMGQDIRFRSKQYLFYALNMVENARVRSSIAICGKLKQNNQNVENLVSNLHLVMRSVRGSNSYWKTGLAELLAMVKVIGPGQMFLTLSCNDLNWDWMHKMCLIEDGRDDINPSTLSMEERQKLIDDHPVLVSRLFNREVQNMIRLLKNGQALKGWKAEDYWYRIEWQQRGSPHCHMIIWIKDFPQDLKSPEGISAIDKIIRCDLPKDDTELAEMVNRLQKHRCSKKTCFKNNRNTCRFGFPRAPCPQTRVLDLDSAELMKNGNRIVQMQRQSGDEYINNYIDIILYLWDGNMDCQIFTTLAVIMYVAKYAGKADKEDLDSAFVKAINEARKATELMRTKLFKCAMKSLSERQVSGSESAYRLCHLRMRGCSRDIPFINTSLPEERYKMLKIAGENSDDENTYFKNIIDKYCSRPRNMINESHPKFYDFERMSLAEFVCIFRPYYRQVDESMVVNEENGDAEFADDPSDNLQEDEIEGVVPTRRPKLPIYRLQNNCGLIQMRQRPAVFRSRYFSSMGDRKRYFYSLLLLHLPFREELELLNKLDSNERYNEEDTEQAFIDKHHLMRPLDPNRSFDEYRQCETEIYDVLGQIRAMGRLDGTTNPNVDGLIDGHPTVNDTVDETDLHVPEEPNVFEGEPHPQQLNGDQRRLYDYVQRVIVDEIEKHSSNEPIHQQIRVFTTGSAGTGKTRTIVELVKLIKTAYRPIFGHHKVVYLTAPTGVAARLINGQTLHSALALGIEHGKVLEYKELSGDFLEQKRQQFAKVRFLIIDEISMVSYEMFKYIERRLRQLKDNNELFGGIHMLLFGDLMQLPPVQGHPIYKAPQNRIVLNLWRLFDFCELEQNMRQKDDQPFVELLNALRVGKLTAQHRKMLQTRVVGENNVVLEGQFSSENSTLIAPVTRSVNDHNIRVLSKLTTTTANNPNPPKEYLLRAQDRMLENNRGVEIVDISKAIPENINKCAGVPKELEICVGARVMLRRNLCTSEGLVNGSLGRVVAFKWPGFRLDQIEEGELPAHVEVHFDGIGLYKIEPTVCTFNGKKGYGKIERRQVPLILAWAVTAHKLQGVTVNNAVLDLGPDLFAKGQPYVMLSRARNLDQIVILRKFAIQKLNTLVNRDALRELYRLRRLPEANIDEFLAERDLESSMRLT